MSRCVLFLCCVAFLFTFGHNSVAQTCSPGSTDPSVTICMPQNGDALNSPIHLQIATNDSSQVDMLQVWYNGVKRWQNPVSSADFFLAAGSGGPYRITAIAHDVSGRWFQSTVNIDVTGEIYVCTQPQTANQSPRSVVICQPADGEIHFSPVHLTWFALAAPGEQPTSVQIFVDGKSVFQTPPALSNGYPLLQTYLPMAVGRHRISVQAYDSQGAFKSTIYMNVNRIYQGCAPPTVLPAMVVCSGLTNGQTVNGIITVKAAAAASTGILRFVEILDGVQVLNTNHAWLDNGLSVAPGPHTVVLKATTNSGVHLQQTFNVTSQ
jgi:Big-like domain-containing protein